MAISAISDWLRSSGPFNAGVELLKLYGSPSKATLFQLSLGDQPFPRKVLITCLEKLNADSDQRVPATQPGMRAPSAVRDPHAMTLYRMNSVEGGRADLRDLPAALKPDYDEVRALYRQESYYRGRMVEIPDGDQLLDVADKVVETYERRKKLWFKIETWRATGDILKETTPVPKDRGALIMERNSIRAQLSKVKHNKTKPDPVRDAKYVARLAEIQLLLDAPIRTE